MFCRWHKDGSPKGRDSRVYARLDSRQPGPGRRVFAGLECLEVDWRWRVENEDGFSEMPSPSRPSSADRGGADLVVILK